mgnify:CR=1 FL=1
MESKVRSKWLVRAVAVGIFLLGFAAGALALNGYRVWSRNRTPSMDRRERFEQMMTRLNLNDDQKKQAHQILSDTREKLQALRKESEPRVNDIRKGFLDYFARNGHEPVASSPLGRMLTTRLGSSVAPSKTTSCGGQ